MLNEWIGFDLMVLGAVSVSFWYSTGLRRLVIPKNMDLRTFCWIVSLIQWLLAAVAGIYIGLPRSLSLMLFFEYGIIWHLHGNTAINLYPIPVKAELMGRKAQTFSWIIGLAGLFIYLVLR
jgi:hypothetical protein